MTKKQEQFLKALNAIKATAQIPKKLGTEALIVSLNDQLEDKDEEISRLEERVEEDCIDTKFDCGISKIEYKQPSNLLLQQLMEAFESAISKQGPMFILQVLETINK